MITPALFVLLSAVGAPPSDLDLTVGAGLGYHRFFAASGNLCIGCRSSAGADGPGLTLSSQLLYGDLLRAGARVEGSLAPFGTIGITGAVLGVVHVGRDLFVDVAGGVGYSWARETYDDGASLSYVTTDGLGFAASVRGGWYLTETVALVVRAKLITGQPGDLSGSAGVEWAL